MIPVEKNRIKYMFAYKHAKKRDIIDLAILTINNEYIEYTLSFKQKYLTECVARRIRSLFNSYLIDANSDIMVNVELNEKHPLYQYLMILHQHINFKLSSLTLDKMISRIYYYFKCKGGSKRFFSKVWNMIIDSKKCPWITQEVDYILQNKGLTTSYRIKTIRMAMFYIIIKNHLYSIVKKSITKTRNI